MQLKREENILLNTIGQDTSIKEEVEKYIRYWWWFVLGAVLSIFVAYLYLRYVTPEYSATTSILIKDNQKSGISKELEVFKDLGIIGSSSSNNPDNEIEILKSRKILENVVHKLNLTSAYFKEGRIKKVELYNSKPINIEFLVKDSILNDEKFSFIFFLKSEDNFDIKNDENEVISSYKFGELITNNLGIFKVLKTKKFNSNVIGKNIFVNLYTKESVINSLKRRVNISLINEKSSVLRLTLQDPIKEKAEDFLNELIREYNINAINDKNEVSKKTKEFIDERITSVFEDLEKIQDKVKDYKAKNNISGLSKEGELALENASINNERIIAVRLELDLAKWIKNHLNEDSLKEETLPQSFGFSNQNISLLIVNYNKLLSEKNKLSVNAGEKNPKLIQTQTELASLKSNLKRSVSNLELSLAIRLKELNREAFIVNFKVSSIPALERGIIDIVREQEIISSLYSYLLKKKEEIAISLAITVPNAKIIDVAYGFDKPVFPKKNFVYLTALLIGLFIPFSGIYLFNLLDNKVYNKKDVESLLSVPFLGDIPKDNSKEKIVIGNDIRSNSPEAFRLIKTNLDFMLANNTSTSKFIFVTSTTSGEGKTFISLNLAATLALSGKRILLMGMDLRAPKITEYLDLENKQGITNYIINKNLDFDSIKFNIEGIDNLDIISSGAIPPNPAELLISKSVDDLFKEVKNHYHYIVVDTPPVNLVTDTLLISKYADMFLYIVRANYTDKRLLAVPEQLHKDKRLPNMAIVLNGTDPKRAYGYGSQGYGGYAGYGYGHLAEQAKPWYKKIFSKS